MACRSYVTSQPGGQRDPVRADLVEGAGHLRVPRPQREQCTHLQQEGAVVADVVDDPQRVLALRPSQAAAELL